LFLLSSQKSTFCLLAEKLWIRLKNGCTFYDGHDEIYHRAKFGRDEQWVPAVGVKIWCFFLFLVTSESWALCVWGVHRLNKHYIAVYWPILTRFSAFFHKGLHFQMHYIVLISTSRWRHIFFAKLLSNCEKSKNWWKRLCAPLRIDSWEIWRKFYCSSSGLRM